MGEEIVLSARFWTAGFDIYEPSSAIVAHEYVREGAPKYWETIGMVFSDGGMHNSLSTKVLPRVQRLLGMPSTRADADEERLPHMREFGLGKERSRADFLQTMGIDMGSLKQEEPEWCRKGEMPAVKQLKAVQYMLKKLSASSNTKASKSQFKLVKAELKKNRASRATIRLALKRVRASSNTKASKAALRKARAECQKVKAELRKSKASVKQLKAVRNQLKKVSASSSTKASKDQLSKVRSELRKTKASVKQLRAVRAQQKKDRAASKGTNTELKKVKAELKKNKASRAALRAVLHATAACLGKTAKLFASV